MKEKYRCSRCGLYKIREDFHEMASHKTKRPVTYHCKECRSDRKRWLDTFSRQLKKYRYLCVECEYPRDLVENRICKPCLAKRGMKYCHKCEQVLLKELNFYNNKAICKECYADR
jgi:hypothetical protein